MVNLPKNGTILIQTVNTLYTLVVTEELGMAIQGHPEYCPTFTEISNIQIQPGQQMLYTLKRPIQGDKKVLTSPVREIHQLKSFDGPECHICGFVFVYPEGEGGVWINDDKQHICPCCVSDLMKGTFAQHEDHGDVTEGRS